MKRYLFIIFLFVSTLTSAQVINFGKTLPVRSFSIGTSASYNVDTYVNDGGMSFMAFGGFGIGYSLDVNVKYGYYPGKDFFGADMQYLFKETRKSYFSVIGGLHYQDDFGFDLTGSYTYSPQFWINFTVGLDFDLILSEQLGFRAWIPLNAGVNLGDLFYIFFEYDLPANDKAWDIISLGVNYIFR
ncbi:hypothetical protein ACFLQX_00740 [Bacteroidota bacterium]